MAKKNFRGIIQGFTIIEDISILTEESVYFKELKFLNLKDNPIRKGLEVLNKNFFTKCIYIEVNITKIEQEYKISSEFKEPNYDLDFFITNINEIKNIFDNQKIFINYCPYFDEFTENEKLEKQEIYRVLKLILNKDNNWIYSLDINIKEHKDIITIFAFLRVIHYIFFKTRLALLRETFLGLAFYQNQKISFLEQY